MQYHVIPSNTVQYHAIPCNTMRYHAIPCNTIQYHAIPFNTMQYYAIQCITKQYHAIPFIINNCWRSVPLPCGQYMAIFSFKGPPICRGLLVNIITHHDYLPSVGEKQKGFRCLHRLSSAWKRKSQRRTIQNLLWRGPCGCCSCFYCIFIIFA